jgi:hypothetical protein
MKTFLSILCLALLAGCSKNGITDAVTLDKAAGKWGIHGVRYQVFTGSPTPKDSSVPWVPNPENFIKFDGVASMQYSFNSPIVWTGDYSLIGNDSISINIDHQTTRWKILLLTETNFNIEMTSTNHPSFPGATVKTFQGFIR